MRPFRRADSQEESRLVGVTNLAPITAARRCAGSDYAKTAQYSPRFACSATRLAFRSIQPLVRVYWYVPNSSRQYSPS